MGPSGSGKTTLLNCLSGLDAVDSGEILIEGVSLSAMSDVERTDYRARRMGFVFQFYNLMPVLSAVEYVELPLLVARVPVREARRKALASFELVGLADRADHLPDELSGGQRQRVTIARSLVNEPAIVWADEPTGDLDSENAEEIVALMRRLNREHGLTFVAGDAEPDVRRSGAATVFLFSLKPGVDPKVTAKALESAFLSNGLQADSLRQPLDDAVAGSRTFDRLVEGFMGLGLIVGVAALGVITARSVVERRQQIGVLRAIGFRRRAVQLSFLIESSFIALTSILIGTALGLAVAFSVISDSRRQPSWSNLSFDVPWLALGAIFLVVYAVALATTLAPSVRASRVYPAEALRYQ